MAISTATRATARQRKRLVATSTRCRRQRSSSTPANGPTTEYGSSRVAKAAAIAAGSAARSGLNSTAPARLAWKTPSAHWLASRVPYSRRKSAPRSTDRSGWPGRSGSSAADAAAGTVVLTSFTLRPPGPVGATRGDLVRQD